MKASEFTKNTRKIIKQICLLCYPKYTGHKFFVMSWDGKPIDCTSYWCEGSRTYYTFIRADGKTMCPPDSAPWIQVKENRMANLVPGLFLVRHSFFQGHDCGCGIIVHPNDMPKFIEKKK